MDAKNDQIYFSLQDSHCDPTSRIENSSLQRSQVFQEGHYEFYDPIVEWLERSYLASYIIGIKFQSLLMLVKKLGAYEDTFARDF